VKESEASILSQAVFPSSLLQSSTTKKVRKKRSRIKMS